MHFVGYSMGTSHYLMMLSELPEYNRRIRSAHLLGPMSAAGNATHPTVALADAAETVKGVADFLGFREIMPRIGRSQDVFADLVCRPHPHVCRAMFALVVNMSPEELDERAVVNYFLHMPSGASAKQIVHYAQHFRNGGKFTKYDHGRVGNLLRYGHLEPPEYDVSQITAPTALYSGAADTFAAPADADKLAARLPNLLANRLVGGDDWTHIHFGFSRRARAEVYDLVLEDMRRADEEKRTGFP